jgi:hypothetical protein
MQKMEIQIGNFPVELYPARLLASIQESGLPRLPATVKEIPE